MRALDDLLPSYHHHETHEVEVEAEPKTAVATFLAGPSSPGGVTGTLLRLRGLPSAPTIEELLTRMGFEVLSRQPAEVVLGAAGRPWTFRGGVHAFADAGPGEVRMAVDVRAAPLDESRSVLSTETRIEAVDERARRAFRRYWLVVAPFSALIRRRWLRGAVRACRDGVPGFGRENHNV